MMDRSPKGREIEPVKGNPSDIISRGKQIKSLGEKMLDSADMLKTIKQESIGDGSQRGDAIEKLKESIGDSYKMLRQAGNLYKPVGPVLVTYGTELADCKPTINNAVEDCEDKWAAFVNLPGDEDGSTTPEAGGGFLFAGGYDADSPEAKEKAAENAAKAQAFQAWLEAAEEFDGGYDDWELAFEDAVDGIEDELSGSIKDSRWSDITDVLEVAALVVGIAAIIIAGPIMAALALAVGAALLISTIMAHQNGERSGTDIAFAVVGVIPFTKISSVTKLSHIGKGASKSAVLKNLAGIDSLKGLKKSTSDLLSHGPIFHKSGLVGAFRNRGAAAGFMQLLTGSPTGYRGVLRSHRSFFEGAGEAKKLIRDSPRIKIAAGVDYGSNIVSTTYRNISLTNLLPGVELETNELPTPIQFAI